MNHTYQQKPASQSYNKFSTVQKNHLMQNILAELGISLPQFYSIDALVRREFQQEAQKHLATDAVKIEIY